MTWEGRFVRLLLPPCSCADKHAQQLLMLSEHRGWLLLEVLCTVETVPQLLLMEHEEDMGAVPVDRMACYVEPWGLWTVMR